MLLHICISGEWDMYFDTDSSKMYETPGRDREIPPANPESPLAVNAGTLKAFVCSLQGEEQHRGKNAWTELNKFFRQFMYNLPGYTEGGTAFNLVDGFGQVKKPSSAEIVKLSYAEYAEENRCHCPRVLRARSGETWIWDTILFGHYPKTEICEGSKEYSKLTQAKVPQNQAMFCLDDGQQYFRLSQSQVRDAAFGGTGNQEEAWSGKLYRFFRVEPISWRILEGVVEGNHATLLLLSDQGVDCKSYHHKHAGVTWLQTSLCHWMNASQWMPGDEVRKFFYTDSFINLAFSPNEQAKLQPFRNEFNDPVITKYTAKNGEVFSAELRVSLLSMEDAFNRVYGFLPRPDDASTENQIYAITATDYAVATGADHLEKNICGMPYKNLCGWEIAEQGLTPAQVTGFNYDGRFAKDGYAVCKKGFEGAVRPLIKIRLPLTDIEELLCGTVSATHKY